MTTALTLTLLGYLLAAAAAAWAFGPVALAAAGLLLLLVGAFGVQVDRKS